MDSFPDKMSIFERRFQQLKGGNMQTHDKAKELLNCRKNHATLSASSVGDVEKDIIT